MFDKQMIIARLVAHSKQDVADSIDALTLAESVREGAKIWNRGSKAQTLWELVTGKAQQDAQDSVNAAKDPAERRERAKEKVADYYQRSLQLMTSAHRQAHSYQEQAKGLTERLPDIDARMVGAQEDKERERLRGEKIAVKKQASNARSAAADIASAMSGHYQVVLQKQTTEPFSRFPELFDNYNRQLTAAVRDISDVFSDRYGA